VKARIGDNLRFLGVDSLVIAPSVDPMSKLSAELSRGLGDISEYSAIALSKVSRVSVMALLIELAVVIAFSRLVL
jgi:hypothetical protein